ncbi:carbohydrate ABC transporter substrate-binding protein [Gemmobacter lutimaris]|uniref:Carbohydrate ABC transporter substrate-binding protein n=1 Tax=Gemmobacter lutimaris TaxID=2306023 RepID=A0A398BV19_9RHOB|nr:ABC transporter substrate-binding protein [Gemmobacter lutimaris]RID91133.1 carbohydrate ABC transporter substrate-binding protein [Gemmobacter lutimaris]
MRLTSTAMALALLAVGAPAWADMDAAKKFLDSEIAGMTVLSPEDQEKEMQWFIDAAKPYAGMDIKVVSETIATHEYEAKVLAPAFTAITGIKITHDLIGEGDVVEKLQTQMQTGENIYDAYVNDSDLIGTHWRYQQARNLTDWMTGEGKDVTSPGLDLADFIGTQFTTAPDGKLYQLPDQQFANLYWFRYDWFTDPKTMEDFKAKYGYDLGVPVNWSAYEDIAEFFTGRDMSYVGGPASGVYGNMDYGKKDPSLGWRYTDAWMSMAGMGDKGEPNGLPVDEWGVRVDENSRPVGSCVARGGATNDAAAVYAVTKAIDWLQKYTPPEAQGMTFGEAGPVPAQGNIAQQMFWYTAFTADMVKPGPVMNEDGTPKWRMAPSPHGAYWAEGTKIGYQDVGSWTLMKSTPVDRAQAAWLYAQFVTSKLVDLKKSDVGLTFIRQSTIDSQHFTDRAPKLGGLIEFYRSPARTQWSPTGTNIPDYPKLAQLWWQNIGDALSGAKSPQEALDSLCADQEKVLIRLEKSGVQGDIGPKMNEEQDPQYWIDQPGSPVGKLDNEKPQGETVSYDELIKSWQN